MDLRVELDQNGKTRKKKKKKTKEKQESNSSDDGLDILFKLVEQRPYHDNYFGPLCNIRHNIRLLTQSMMISLAIGVLTTALIIYYVWFKVSKGQQVLPRIIPINDPNKPRFRKRDKVLFYGRKMIRRLSVEVRSLTKPELVSSGRRMTMAPGRSSRKHLEVLKIAKKLLRIKKDQEPRLKPQEPPAAFFESDWKDELSDYKLPAEVMYMLKSVRVLGHFEKPIFLELCRYMDSRFVPAGTHLFKIGEHDDSIFVVQSGRVNVYIKDQDGADVVVKRVSTGDNIHSLLSILDVLTGHPAPFKTVNAVAEIDSTVLRLPAKAFQIVLDRFPESMVRVVQIIMVRLQRVTFTALHDYLGLTYELMNQHARLENERSLSVHSIGISVTGSPIKLATQATTADSQAEPTDHKHNTDDDLDGLQAGSSVSSNPIEIKQRRLSGAGSNRTRESVKSALKISVDAEPSDFDVACSRARVGQLDSTDPIVSGTPPAKAVGEDMFFRGSSKRVSVSGKMEVIPDSDMYSGEVQHLDDQQVLSMALTDIRHLFGLKDEKLLEGKCHLRHLKNGMTVIRQGDQDASLYFLVTGKLNVSQAQIGQVTEQASLFVVQPGELVGTLAVLTGEPSFFKVKARADSMVVVISKQDFYMIMKEQPRVVLNIGHTVVKRMSPFVRQIDFALDWMYLEAGKSLFRQGDPSASVFIVLSGRMRSVLSLPSGKKELAAEYGRGELVGIVEVLTQTERATTLMAIRDSELAQLPDSLLNLIKRKYPQVVTRLIHLLGQRILGTLKKGGSPAPEEHRPTVANLNTVAILPVSEDVPLYNFTLELQHSLNAIGSTLRLTSETIQNRLGPTALDSVNEYRLSSWLGQQEDIQRMVLYQCDYTLTPWTQRCIRQADCLLIVCLAQGEPKVGQIEKEIEQLAVRAQKELILLHHDDDGVRPKNTVEWLNARGWCSSHHHIRCPKRVFSKRSKSKMRKDCSEEEYETMQVYRELLETEPDRLSDFSRLARFLTGTAIGLVLGGGGARGISHVGIIRSMVEAGIPIDIVGGTSIGSFVAALWAEEKDVVRCTQRAREWSMEFKKTWKKVFDLTYPMTAMFKGAAFNSSIREVFKDRQIEDLWIPYFCISTDITASQMRVHTSGSLWRYVRASMSICGYLPPMCDPRDGHLLVDGAFLDNLPGSLWRYVRSSMSLSGYLPPLCDPVDAHMLLDGGYVNNLPADVMKSMGAQNIFAVDVGAQDETDFTNFGDELSGWWMLWKRWNPWAKPVKIPNLGEIQSRLAYVSCVKQLEQVKDSGEFEYIRPPIDKFTTLQFGAFDDIFDVGYAHGKALFAAWVKKDLVKDLFLEKKAEAEKHNAINSQKNYVPAEANFTDLAELVSRINKPQYPFGELDSDDEYEDEEDDNMSVESEPGVSHIAPSNLHHRNSYRARSEGGSPADSNSPTEEFKMPPEFCEGNDDECFTDSEGETSGWRRESSATEDDLPTN